MKITYTHSAGVTAELPAGDELARHATEAYGHTLNTPERVNHPHGARDFAQAIREVYDMAEPRNAAIVEHLESLEPDAPMKTYSHVGDAGSNYAILTSAAGYDLAVLHPVTRDAPGLTPEHHLSPEEWQGIITLVDAAPAMLAALQALGAAIEGGDPQDIADAWHHAQALIPHSTKP
jgi:hypothetical protein